MLDLSQLREVIDGLAARLVVEKGRSQGLDRTLQRYIGDMQAAADLADTKSYIRAHTDFHRAILEASGNVWLEQLIPTVSLGSQVFYLRLPGKASGSFGNPDAKYIAFLVGHVQSHRELVDVLRSETPEAAEGAARHHIEMGRHEIAEYL
jgi:DNA-binding GntR family transcriptional regulator